MIKLIARLATGTAVIAHVSAACAAGKDTVYDLGEIHILAADAITKTFNSFSGSAVSSSQIETFTALTLDRAVNLAPGVVSAPDGGSRNEQEIYVHGFNRYQVPLYVDGIRSYYPASNQLAFPSLLTDDYAAIQIAKGYVSVLDGPDGLGGAINLVSKRPTKAFEAEARTTFQFGNGGRYDGAQTHLRVGTKQENYFLQASGTFAKFEGWELPDSYRPTATENGGRRDWSKFWNANGTVKAGFTPNGDEYVVSYSIQGRDKYTPPTTTGISSKNYSWSEWRTQTLSFSSRTAIDEATYVKTQAFIQSFDEAMSAYEDAARTLQKTGKNSFNTYAHDWAPGGALEVGHDFGSKDTLKGSFHYQRNNHVEWRDLFVNASGTTSGCRNNVVCLTEPHQGAAQDLYSLALENTYHLSPSVDLVQGIAYNWQHQIKAQDYVVTGGRYRLIDYALNDRSSFDWQGAAIWRYSDTGKVHADISHRSRFATLWDLYGSKFGSSDPNPTLRPERATSVQIGWSNEFAPKSQISVDVYYSAVQDMMQTVVNPATGNNWNQNVGDGYRVGVDLGIDYMLREGLAVGGNLSLIDNHLTVPSDPNIKPTGVPNYKGMVYASWVPMEKVTLVPSVEFAANRWDQVSSAYVQTGAYTLANFMAKYEFSKNLEIDAAVNNIFDREYALTSGNISPGRTIMLSMKATF